jgi:hypothetical protein
MRASELLRKMADLIDSREGSQEPTEIQSQEPVAMVQGDEHPTTTQGIEGEAQVNTVAMIGPLQQKLELLKKAAGIENMYDGGEEAGEECCDVCACEPCVCDDHGNHDELSIIKKNAGIPVAIQVSAEDNDVEG